MANVMVSRINEQKPVVKTILMKPEKTHLFRDPLDALPFHGYRLLEYRAACAVGTLHVAPAPYELVASYRMEVLHHVHPK